MTQAIGYSANVSTLLGYLRVDQSVEKTAATITKNAVNKSLNVWNSYLRNTGSGISIPAYFNTATTAAPNGARMVEGSYYYALEFIAEEYARVRLGNVGTQTAAQQQILARVQQLLQIARDGINRFEQWCASESAVYGADFVEYFGGFAELVPAALDEAKTYWESYRADLASLDTVSAQTQAIQNRIAFGGYGYSLKNMGTKMMAKRLGYSGARNNAIGQYYSNIGQQLFNTSKTIIASYEAWVAATKPAHALRNLGF